MQRNKGYKQTLESNLLKLRFKRFKPPFDDIEYDNKMAVYYYLENKDFFSSCNSFDDSECRLFNFNLLDEKISLLSDTFEKDNPKASHSLYCTLVAGSIIRDYCSRKLFSIVVPKSEALQVFFVGSVRKEIKAFFSGLKKKEIKEEIQSLLAYAKIFRLDSPLSKYYYVHPDYGRVFLTNIMTARTNHKCSYHILQHISQIRFYLLEVLEEALSFSHQQYKMPITKILYYSHVRKIQITTSMIEKYSLGKK